MPASGSPRSLSFVAFFGPKPVSRISSSSARNWRYVPGSPCRPQRPMSWRSMRCDFVQLGADDVQAAELGDALAEPDVGAAAGHVRGDGDFALLAGVRRRSPLPPRRAGR